MFIEETSEIIGYSQNVIKRFMGKHERRRLIREITTLKPMDKPKKKTIRTSNGKEKQIFEKFP